MPEISTGSTAGGMLRSTITAAVLACGRGPREIAARDDIARRRCRAQTPRLRAVRCSGRTSAPWRSASSSAAPASARAFVRLATAPVHRRRSRAGAAPPYRRCSPAPTISTRLSRMPSVGCQSSALPPTPPTMRQRRWRSPRGPGGQRAQRRHHHALDERSGGGAGFQAGRTCPRISASPSTSDSRPQHTRKRWSAAARPRNGISPPVTSPGRGAPPCHANRASTVSSSPGTAPASRLRCDCRWPARTTRYQKWRGRRADVRCPRSQSSAISGAADAERSGR